MHREGMLYQVWNEPLGRYTGGRFTRSLAWYGIGECESSIVRGECEMVWSQCWDQYWWTIYAKRIPIELAVNTTGDPCNPVDGDIDDKFICR